MRKKDILRAVSAKTNFTIENCEIAFDAFTEVLAEAMMADEDKIVLNNVGTFKRKVRKARTCRNPHTGENIEVPERIAYTFKPMPKFAEALNNK